MVEVIRRLSQELPNAPITLIGYSGGGVLAVLVANRVHQVDVVVTIGANLDIDAWTGLHGYTPLSASLNPASVSAWRTDLRQVHLVGGRDRNVPAYITTDFAQRIAAAEVHTYDTFDHRCCWIDVWPRPLDIVGRAPCDREIPLD
jgi:dienelactone hydrolase